MPLSLVHEDARRAIYEMNDPEKDISVQYFDVKAPIPLGNHYHINKMEVFTILDGRGVIVRRRVDPETKELTGRGETLEVGPGDAVRVEAWTAHTFIMEPGSRMVCLSTKAFDKEDMHTAILVVPEAAAGILQRELSVDGRTA